MPDRWDMARGAPPGRRHLTIAALAVGVLLIVLGLVAVLSDNVLREDFGGQDEMRAHGIQALVGHEPNLAWLFFPGPEQELDEVRDYASVPCADQSVEDLSAALGTMATPEAVAQQYAEEVATPQRASVQAAIYDGCLEGFGEGRDLIPALSRVRPTPEAASARPAARPRTAGVICLALASALDQRVG